MRGASLYVIYLNVRIKICQQGSWKKLESCSGAGFKNTTQRGLRIKMMIFRLSETPADWRLQSDRGRKEPVSHAISVKKVPSQTG